MSSIDRLFPDREFQKKLPPPTDLILPPYCRGLEPKPKPKPTPTPTPTPAPKPKPAPKPTPKPKPKPTPTPTPNTIIYRIMATSRRPDR